MIWLFIAIISATTSLALLGPLLSRKTEMPSDGLGVFAGQLEELARDRSLDLISVSEAQTARLEIKRRLLAASESAEIDENPSISLRRLAVMSMGIPTALAVVIYLQIGSPHLVDTPAIAYSEPVSLPDDPAVLAAVNALVARLAENPDDLDGWLLLGPYLMSTGQYAEAAFAFDQATGLTAANANLYTALGEAQLAANRGVVIPVARDAFERALELEPQHSRAQFFLALAWFQDGEIDRARQSWTDIVQGLPVEDPFRVMIENQLAMTQPATP